MNCYAIACEYFVLYGACVGMLIGVILTDGIHKIANERRDERCKP